MRSDRGQSLLLATKLQLSHGLVLEALLRERGSGTSIESQSTLAKWSFEDIGVTKPASPPTLAEIEAAIERFACVMKASDPAAIF